MRKIYLIATILALITGATVYLFANQLNLAASQEILATSQVACMSQNVDENTVLTPEMITYKHVPTDAVPKNAVLAGEAIVGRITSTKMYAGEQVISDKLIAQGEADNFSLCYSLAENERAITIPVDEISGIAGYLEKGNKVDIISSYEENGVVKTKILLENIKIIRLGTNTGANTVNIAYTNVTLAVTPEQSLIVSEAALNGVMRLILRPAGQ